jgi:hypothetical protein
LTGDECDVGTDPGFGSLSQPSGIGGAVQSAWVRKRLGYEQQPPPQQPPEGAAGAAAVLPGLAVPPTATMEKSLTVSAWPAGQSVGAEDSLIGRVFSKVSPQARQRYS